MIQGIYASNQGIVGERAGDFATAILMYEPTGSALFLAMTAGMGKEDAADTSFTWLEDSHNSGRTAAVSGGTSTTVVAADASFYPPNTVLLVEETGEHLLVTATSGNSMTVLRGLAGTSIVSITSSHYLQKIGNAHPEGSGMPTAVTQQGAPRTNYTQIFRNGWAITGTAKAVKYLTGSKLAYNKKMCASYHAEDMERAFLWGKKAVLTVDSKQMRLTDGVVTQIESYGGTVLSAATNSGMGAVAGDLSRVDLEDFLQEVFATNVKGQPNERIALGGNGVLSVIQKMAFLDGTYNISQGETKLGIAITTIQTPYGTIKLMTHPLMNENPTWTKEMYLLHPGGIKRRMLRETFEEGYDKNGLRIQGKDADEGVVTTEAGVQVGGARSMGILRNVSNAVASSTSI